MIPTSLRRIRPDDQNFLYQLYASTRQEELAVLDWDEAQKTAFLRMQFEAQHKYYLEQFTQAQFDIILLDEEPIGRLYVDRRDNEIRLIDIALLPTHRNRGIGSAYLARIMAEGQFASLPVRIHVEQNNPALRLYHRLGFREIEESGVYYLMEWKPNEGDNSVD